MPGGGMRAMHRAWSSGNLIQDLFRPRASGASARAESPSSAALGDAALGPDDERPRGASPTPTETDPDPDTDTDYDTASEGDLAELDRLLLHLDPRVVDHHPGPDPDPAPCGRGDHGAFASSSSSPSPSRRASLDGVRRAVSHPVPADAAAHHWSAECDVLDWLRVRGRGYLVDRRKRIPETPVMECVKVDIFSFQDKPHYNVAETRPESWLRRQRAAAAAAAKNQNGTEGEAETPWTFVFQFMNPGPPYVSIAAYFRPTGAREGMSLSRLLEREKGTPFGNALARFVDADKPERDRKFKMVCALMSAPWALRSVVPRRPVILGKKTELRYHRSEDHMEIDFELAASPFMDRTYRALKWASRHSVEELVFMIEGQREDELPEAILGAVRLDRVDERAVTPLPPLESRAGGGG